MKEHGFRIGDEAPVAWTMGAMTDRFLVLAAASAVLVRGRWFPGTGRDSWYYSQGSLGG